MQTKMCGFRLLSHHGIIVLRYMKPHVLILRGLTYYWRTNAAVLLGVATAVAVLSGALLVGDSVRGSLRDLVLQRLGRTDQAILSAGFVRERLAADLQGHQDFSTLFDEICPIIIAQGFVTEQSGNGRAGRVSVYGVDDRFWHFHEVRSVTGPAGRDTLISPALARELGIQNGATILVRVQRPSDIPLESLHGRKDDLGRTIRATVREVLSQESLGEFSLQPQQGEVRAVFLPLSRLQQDLDLHGRVNTFLVSAKSGGGSNTTVGLESLVRAAATLEDLGLSVNKTQAGKAIALNTDAGVLDDKKADAALEAARSLRLDPRPVFTYLVNSLRSGERVIPYSLVTAIDTTSNADPSSIVLNDWAARDLQSRVGDAVTLEYFVWEEPGRLVTRSDEFRVTGIVPIDTRDRDFAPTYPGITESPSLADWDPPFPIDLRRIRPVDEAYWRAHRTTPKAFIPFAAGRRLWQSRYGAMTSIQFRPRPDQSLESLHRDYSETLRATIDPLSAGLIVRGVRAEGLSASRGATDFGAYFVYFSFFLVGSALMLAALFFKLSVEQRAREVGLLRAVGFRPEAVTRLFVWEGFLLSAVGAAIGAMGGWIYAWAMVTGLRTWWIDAVGTSQITLHMSPLSLLGGAAGGIVAATVCIWLTLRHLSRVPERRLLAEQLTAESFQRHTRRRPIVIVAALFACIGCGLLIAASVGLIDDAAAFFGAGSALLIAVLCFFVNRFGQAERMSTDVSGRWSISRLGVRSARYRPARSVLSVAMIAAASFILISVEAFRKDDAAGANDRRSGTGGYSLLVESILPVVQDPGSREARRVLGLAAFDSVRIEGFRVRPGDDTSCLNLYEPTNPRIVAPSDAFIAAGRFSFQDSLASNDAEHGNPWLLLQRKEQDGVVPVIADANSMTYVLHRKLGDDIVMTVGNTPVRLRLVAALQDSVFQGELLMSQTNFLKLFPEQEGYSLLLVDAAADRQAEVASAIENGLQDFGAVVTPAAKRLAEFHRVENTYLSTFQMLGGLGLILGTVGLGAVMLRNVMERRRELALLRALGYKQTHLFAIVTAENVLLLVSGLATGIVCALLAIGPVVMSRTGRLPALSVVALLVAVFAVGLVVSLAATVAAIRSPVLAGLRTE